MKEQTVSHKVAELAQDVGCKLKIFGVGYTYYTDDGIEMWTITKGGIQGNKNTKRVVILSQSLLQKWLREEHNIHIEISLNDDGITKFDVAIYKINPEAMWLKISYRLINTYEEALEKGLYEALKLIQKYQK